LLSNIPDITIDSLISAGSEPAEYFMYSPMECGPDGYTARDIDKSYWFAFSVETAGRLELLITPEDLNTDYDFALFKGFCPNDPCSEPVYCLWRTNFCLSYEETGIAADPLTTFGIDPDSNIQVVAEELQLEAGHNYYLLVENRNESLSLDCPLEDSLGFTIQFDGTATIGPLLDRPDINPTVPADTSETITVCQGDRQVFAVSQVPNASNYDWVSKTTLPDATITSIGEGDSVTVEFGATSGQLCMEIVCPVQSVICWDIQVAGVPDLEEIPNPDVVCGGVDLETRFRDNNNVAGATLAFFASEADANQDINPLASNIVTSSGTYWVKKSVGTTCSDLISVNVLTETIEIEPIMGPIQICDATFTDLSDLEINNALGDNGDLVYLFFADSLDAVNDANGILPPVVFTSQRYYVKAVSQAGGTCFDIKGFDLIFEPLPDLAPIPTQEFCGGECVDFNTIELRTTDGRLLTGYSKTFFASEAAAQTGDVADALKEICASGTYWINAKSSPSCQLIISFEVSAFPAPDIDDVVLSMDCQLGCVDLNNSPFVEKNGIDASSLEVQYFATEADANDPGASPFSNLIICNPTEVWGRMINTATGCFDVGKVTINGMQLASASLSGDQSFCAGEERNLTVTLTGLAPFTLSYTDGTNNFDITAPNNTLNIPVTPDSTTVYTLVEIQDANNCSGGVSGTATLSLTESPSVINLSQDCNLTATEYTVTFDLEGGDMATYNVSGTSGQLTGNTFTSDPLPTGASYSFQITDGNACPATELSATFSCECNSVVGKMDQQPILVCDREPAIGFYLNGENLEKGDILTYVLHDRADETLGNIVSESDRTIFRFDANTMEYGVTYYMSAVVTKEDIAGNSILNANNNPCLKVAAGAPVIFHAVPDGHLTVSSTEICKGETVDIVFNLEGVGPFDVNYFDGEKIAALMAIDSGHTLSLSPNITSDFYIETVRQTGVINCSTNLINSNVLEVTVFELPTIDNFKQSCNEVGTQAVITFDINNGASGNYTVNGIAGSLNGSQFISDSLPAGTAYSIEVIGDNNCTSVLLEGSIECLCTPDIMVAIELVKPVSCSGEQDAILNADPINGAFPYTYVWSLGQTGQRVEGIAPGLNWVTMTDGNGCEVTDSIRIEAPTSISASSNVVPISCYGEKDGGILIVGAQGGTGPYTYSFNNSNFQATNLRESLGAGAYPVAIKDANGCVWTEEVIIENPPQLSVTLGGNKVLNLGDSITLNPQINQNQTSIVWEAKDGLPCSDCLNPTIRPSKSGTYKAIVTNSAGCVAEDEVLVQVQNNQRIFMPNAFSPNGDGSNDLLHPYSSVEVEEISMFRIYNRWGELLYEKKDMLKESNADGWNGETSTGDKAPLGVYLYYLEVLFKDGHNSIITGDVSLIR
jgi:gliding motility-associated-like protein